MSDRDLILTALPESGVAELPKPPPTGPSLDAVDELWQVFAEAALPLGTTLISFKDVPELLEGKAVFRDESAFPYLTDLPKPDDPWQAEIGITLAECAIAETGTLMVCTGPMRHRLASLAPPIHLALVKESRIVRTLEEAIVRVPDRTTVFITGSSRTADIEGVLVRGVHGPKQVYVALV